MGAAPFEESGILVMAKIIKSPAPLQAGRSVFLAGSIEVGAAEDWQSHVENKLAETNLLIFNPRREDWNASWAQNREDAHFRQQVEWELTALEQADIIAIYFAPSTKSPISLLEFGLFARSQKLIVCCPHGFWRKGNVDIVCERYSILQVDTLDELVKKIITMAIHGDASC
jgi:hypothetical protein